MSWLKGMLLRSDRARPLVEIHSLLLDLYRAIGICLSRFFTSTLHTRHLRTIVIRTAAIRAHALQSAQTGMCRSSDRARPPVAFALPARMPAQVAGPPNSTTRLRCAVGHIIFRKT
jgi:hypothetical protein